MIIINKSDNIIEIIEKIENFNEIDKRISNFGSKVEKKIHKKFLKNKSYNLIELYVPENHDLLKTLSLLKLLVEKFENKKIIINSKGIISKEHIEFSKINFICFKETYLQKFQKTKFYTNKIWFSILLLILIFFVISIFFITKSYIHKIYYTVGENKKGEINLTFSKIPSEKNILLNPLITFTQLNKDFLITKLNFNSAKRASGIIEIKNYEKSNFTIKARSQFITKNNLIFENIDDIIIKKAEEEEINKDENIDETGSKKNKKIKPSITNLFVIAKTHTKAGIFIGDKGNIKKNTELNFNKLKDKNIKFIAKSNFTGGNNDISSTLSDDDLKNFKRIYKQKITQKAIYELSEITKFKSREDKKDYIFIENNKIIKFEPIIIENIFLDKDNSSKIILVGNIKAKGYFYDKKEILGKIKDKIDYKNIIDIKLNNLGEINKIKNYNIISDIIKFEKNIKFSYKIINNN